MPVHIEVPSIGELVEIKGSQLGVIEQVNSLSTANTITINEATSKEKCEGGAADKLESEKEHNKKPETAIDTKTLEVAFDKDIEVMA